MVLEEVGGPRSLMCGFVRRDDRGWNRPVAPGTHWISSSDDGVGGWSCGAGDISGVCVPLLRRRVIGTGLPIIQVESGWD